MISIPIKNWQFVLVRKLELSEGKSSLNDCDLNPKALSLKEMQEK